VRLVHRSGAEESPSKSNDASERVLATDIEFAETFLARARGLMFRRSIPDDYALVFRFDSAATRDLHMVFVPFPIDAVWVVDGEVTAVKRLRPWIGLGVATADTVVELPAGAAEEIEPGDNIRVVDD